MPRIKITVEVDLDRIPGWGYDPDDFVKLIDQLLKEQISHYNPVVKLDEQNV